MFKGKLHRPKIPKRMLLTAFSLIMVLVAVILSTVYLTRNVYWAYTFFEILSIIATIVIVNKKGDLSYKIAWIAFITSS